MGKNQFHSMLIVLSLFWLCQPTPTFGGITLTTQPVKVQLYGYVKLEALYENSEACQGDWLLYAYPGNSDKADQRVFSMNARSSRLGLQFDGPTSKRTTSVNALIEWDFSGGFPNSSTAARQPQIRLRHAWFELNNPHWELRLGQDWALITTPFPVTVDAVVGAARGNLWMTFPQIKYTLKVAPFKAAFSINRPISGNVKYDSFTNGDLDIVDDGERNGYPWIMGRLWYNQPNFTASLSGHYGKEQIADQSNNKHLLPTYSLNTDFIIKIKRLTWTTKLFTGENLNSFFGGVLQGFVKTTNTVKNISSYGGWTQITWAMNEKLILTAGSGLDQPNKKQLPDLINIRTRNLWKYANLNFKPNPRVAFMFELSHLTTEYKDPSQTPGRNLRMQFAGFYYF